MADKTKFQSEEFLTPELEVTWANVIKPNTKFKDEGEFQVSVKGTPEQMKALQTQFDKACANAQKKLAKDKDKPAILKYKLHNPVQAEVNKDTGDETGDLVLKTTASAVKKKKDYDTGKMVVVGPRKIQVVDSKLRPVTQEIGRGSIVKIAGYLQPFAMVNKEAKGGGITGVSAKITMVQVLKLVPVSAGAIDPSKLGFKVEDGYDGVADAAAVSEADGEAPADADTSSDAGDADSDF